MAIQEVHALKKLSYFDEKKIVYTANQGKISYAQTVKQQPHKPLL